MTVPTRLRLAYQSSRHFINATPFVVDRNSQLLYQRFDTTTVRRAAASRTTASGIDGSPPINRRQTTSSMQCLLYTHPRALPSPPIQQSMNISSNYKNYRVDDNTYCMNH